MAKDSEFETQQQGNFYSGGLAPHLIPKVQSRIQPKTYSRIQAKLLTGIGKGQMLVNTDISLEKEADDKGKAVSEGKLVTVGGVASISIQRDELDKSKQEEVKPVYYKVPDTTESLQFTVGAAGPDKYIEAVINFSSDVAFLQKQLLNLGLLSQEDYDLESAQEGVETVVPSNNTDSSTMALTELEKKFMKEYGKIPLGKQIPSILIPKTIAAIKIFQQEVQRTKPDGQVSAKGNTIASIISTTPEIVTFERNRYALEKKTEAEKQKKQKEEEQKRLAEQKLAEEKKQAKIKELRDAGSGKAIVEKVYNENSDDMRDLGGKMREYAPYNPQLVIEMLDYLKFWHSDNLAFNIVSNFSDAELGGLDKALLEKLLDEIDDFSTAKTEDEQIERLKKFTRGDKELASDSVAEHSEISGTRIDLDLEEIGTPMLKEDKYQPGNGVTWCNTYCMDLAKKSLGRNPFKDDTDEAKWGINTYGMEDYIKNHPDQWQLIKISNGDFTIAWDLINQDNFVVFFIDGHVATGIKTEKMEKMINAKTKKAYTFGKIIQSGKSVNKFLLVNGFGWRLDEMRVYLYIGPKVK